MARKTKGGWLAEGLKLLLRERKMHMRHVGKRRTFSGEVQIALGILHMLIGLRKYAKPLAAMRQDGVLNSVKDDVHRKVAFWYFITGFSLIMDGFLVHWVLRQKGVLPASHGWSMLAMAVAGVTLVPRSGFWLVMALALLHLRVVRQGGGTQ